jgi:D-glycero-D-manno-heptose 1,7-bisphosphate phosphatase
VGVTRRAVFLDRDGTLNVRPDEHRYVETLERFVWLPGAVDGASALARAGFVLAVASNQRGIARGLVSWSTIAAIEQEIQARLGEQGVQIAAFRYCPHELDDVCDCRKPAPGMLLELAELLDLDLARSWMVGDSASDVAAGHAAGCSTALIAPATARLPFADLVAPSLRAAAAAILEREPLSRR